MSRASGNLLQRHVKFNRLLKKKLLHVIHVRTIVPWVGPLLQVLLGVRSIMKMEMTFQRYVEQQFWVFLAINLIKELKII